MSVSITINNGSDNVTLNNNVDNVTLPVAISVILQSSGVSIINNGFNSEYYGKHTVLTPFLLQHVGDYSVQSFTRYRMGKTHFGEYGIASNFIQDHQGSYDIAIKRIAMESIGSFALLDGSEESIAAQLSEVSACAAVNPDTTTNIVLPRILTLKVWEEQSVNIELQFRKIPDNGTLPEIKTMTWTLQSLDGQILNSRKEVTIVSPYANQIIGLNGDDLQLLEQANEFEWRELIVTATYDPETETIAPTLTEVIRFAVYNVNSIR